MAKCIRCVGRGGWYNSTGSQTKWLPCVSCQGTGKVEAAHVKSAVYNGPEGYDVDVLP